MKQVIKYTSLLIGMIVMLTACNTDKMDELVPNGELKDGTPVTISFTAAVPNAPTTRNVDNVNNLYLVVFDQNHRYLYRTEAQIGGVVDADDITGETYLPNNTMDPIDNKLRRFTVTLLSSSEPRIIHFVANYDWAGFPKDYEIEGTDEGQVIPQLFTERNDNTVYWQSFKFNTISLNAFDNIVFKLLRNQAKFTVKIGATADFTLTGFCVHNAPDKGTIAPFYSKTQLTNSGSFYDDVLYDFPNDPIQSTVMANLVLSPAGDVNTNKDPILTYEYRNAEAGASKQMFLIVKGKFTPTSPDTYYKVDLVSEIKDEHGNYIGSTAFDIVRNNNYIININRVAQEGYATYQEAVIHPAGNNLFASVELEHFPTVSDGTYILSVDNTDAVVVLPGRFTAQIGFSSANSTRDVKVYYQNHLCDGAIAGDDYIDYANYNPDNGTLYVNVKDVPTNLEKTYTFNVIATPSENPTVHIQRAITLKVRPRFDFNAELVEHGGTNNPQGEQVDLTFTIPGTLPENLFPYDVYIAADQLSPYVTAGTNDGMVVEKIGTRIYYKYTVTTKPGNTDIRQTLHFQRTSTDGSSVVTLVSGYYNDGDVILKNSSSVSQSDANSATGKLTFTGLSFTKPRAVFSDYRTTLSVDKPSVTASMASAGYVKLTGLNTLSDSDNLKLTAALKEGGGTITCTKTLTVAEWKNLLGNEATSVDMDISSVFVTGSITYASWSGSAYGAPVDVPTDANLTIIKEDGSMPGNATISLTSAGIFEMNVTGVENVKTPVAFRIEYPNNEYAPRVLVAYSQYLMQLIDNPSISLTFRSDL